MEGVLTSSKPVGLKAVSRVLSVNKEFPLESLKFPILNVIISVASFKLSLIGIEMALFSSEFDIVLEEELLLSLIHI